MEPNAKENHLSFLKKQIFKTQCIDLVKDSSMTYSNPKIPVVVFIER